MKLCQLQGGRALLDFRTRKTLCMALIQPYLDYCCSSWYDGITAVLKKRIDAFQRKMVRFVFGYDNRHHVGLSEFKSLQWLLIPDRVTYFKLIHLFKVRHHRAPSYLRTRFTSVSDSHSHFTRGSHVNLRVSSTFSQVQGSFAYSCVRQWNALPNRIKEIDSLLSFKRALRSYLLDRYN